MPDKKPFDKYYEKYIVWQGLLDGSDISAGKGIIAIEASLLQILDGKLLVLDMLSEKGPCPDDMCQLLPSITAKIVDDAENPSDNAARKRGFSLAVDRDVYRSIDKGREHITVKRKGAGATVKGFTLTD